MSHPQTERRADKSVIGDVSGLAVVIVDVAVGAPEHHFVVVVPGPDANLVAVGIDGDGGLTRAGKHQQPGGHLAAVGDLVGPFWAGRKPDEIAFGQLVFAVRDAQVELPVE